MLCEPRGPGAHREPDARTARPEQPPVGGARASLPAEAELLFETLRSWRTELARERGVPPYVIFDNKTLVELAIAKPESLTALLEISGVGEKKAERHGDDVLKLISAAA